MIRRKLNEEANTRLKMLTESYHNMNKLSQQKLNEVYNLIFEDVESVNTIFIHPTFDESYDWWYGNELFEEVKFNNGETHYFLTEEADYKMLITEVKLPETMLEHREYFDNEF